MARKTKTKAVHKKSVKPDPALSATRPAHEAWALECLRITGKNHKLGERRRLAILRTSPLRLLVDVGTCGEPSKQDVNRAMVLAYKKYRTPAELWVAPSLAGLAGEICDVFGIRLRVRGGEAHPTADMSTARATPSQKLNRLSAHCDRWPRSVLDLAAAQPTPPPVPSSEPQPYLLRHVNRAQVCVEGRYYTADGLLRHNGEVVPVKTIGNDETHVVILNPDDPSRALFLAELVPECLWSDLAEQAPKHRFWRKLGAGVHMNLFSLVVFIAVAWSLLLVGYSLY